MAARDRRFWIAFNLHQLPILVVNQLAASYAAIRADGTRHLASSRLRLQVLSALGPRFATGSVRQVLNLLQERPPRQGFPHHEEVLLNRMYDAAVHRAVASLLFARSKHEP